MSEMKQLMEVALQNLFDTSDPQIYGRMRGSHVNDALQIMVDLLCSRMLHQKYVLQGVRLPEYPPPKTQLMNLMING